MNLRDFSIVGMAGMMAMGAIALGVGGCQSPPPAEDHSTVGVAFEPVNRPATVPMSQPATRPQPTEASLNTAQMLARKTNAYVQDMESLNNPSMRHKSEVAQAVTPPPASGELSPAGSKNAPAESAVKPANAAANRDSEAVAAPQPVAVTRTQPPAAAEEAAKANEVVSIDPRRPEANQPAVAAEHLPVAEGGARSAGQDPSDPLGAMLARQVKNNPRDLAAQLDYQLHQFVENKPVPQLQSMASLPAEDRELVSALIDGLSNFRNQVRADNNMLMAQKVRPLLQMADRIRAEADLTIPTLALCTRVGSYGVYDPIDPARFPAGKEHTAILYCEVANFASALNDQTRQWETKLTETEALYTESGMLVWPAKRVPHPFVDLARNRRHDFFVVKKIVLPANLTIGRYLLKVTIVDQQANRVAEATVPIQIVAQ